LLDEPTNHLDLASQEILEQALQAYDGTVLLVSHDRALLEAVTTQLWRVEDGRLLVSSYGYAEHRRRSEEARHAAAAGSRIAASSGPTDRRSEKSGRSNETTGVRPRKPDKYEQKRLDDARTALERAIEELERRLGEIERDLVTESEAGNGQRIASLGVQHKAVTSDLEAKYREWEALAGKVE